MFRVAFKAIPWPGAMERPDIMVQRAPLPSSTLGPATFAVLAACALLTLCELYVCISLGPAVGHDLGGGSATGLMGVTFGLAYAAGVLAFGPLEGRYGARRILLAGHAVLVLATIGVALAPTTEVLAVGRVAQGLAVATFPPVALAYVSTHAAPRQRPVALAAMTSTFLLAGIVGQVYGSAFDASSWRGAFLGLGAGHLVGALAMARVLAPGRPAGRGVARLAPQLLAALRAPHLPRLLLALSTVLLAFVAMYAALGPRLEELGLAKDDVLLVRLAGIPGMLLAPACGFLVSRFGSAAVAAIALAVAAGGLLVEATADGALPLVVGSAVFVAGVATAVPAFTGLVGDRAPQQRGAALALYSCALFAGASAGSAATSFVDLRFATLCGTLAAFLALAAATVWTSRRAPAAVDAGGPPPGSLRTSGQAP